MIMQSNVFKFVWIRTLAQPPTGDRSGCDRDLDDATFCTYGVFVLGPAGDYYMFFF
jgi:hypothetical protein